jgi:DNA-binding GntR family transcriptional regulator
VRSSARGQRSANAQCWGNELSDGTRPGISSRRSRDSPPSSGREGLAAELAATRITDAQLRELRDAEHHFRRAIAGLVDGRRDQDGSNANGEWTRANDLFHRVIQEAAGNERLADIVQDLHRAFPRGLTWSALSGSSALLRQNVDEHHAILAAIERRDPVEARRRMVSHVRHAGELVAHHFERRAG